MSSPLLQLKGLSKAFGPKKANDNINITIEPGQVHALVGENGAGKTTLMNMIAGQSEPDSGQIIFEGEEVQIPTPQRAAALGIGMVHQHFKLVPSLTVADNVYLGREPRNRFGVVDHAAMVEGVRARAERIGLQIDPNAKIEDLSVGEKQRVEVLKALNPGTKLLILDEPTAVLTPQEVDELFEVVRSLVAGGCSVFFVSHKLGEVLAISDVLTVIRDGQSIDTVPTEGLSQKDIARMMVGRDVLLRIDHIPSSPKEEVLSVDRLSVADDRGVMAVRNLSLSVRAGEVVGIAGVEGNGQTELAAAIAGMERADRGKILLNGADITSANVGKRRRLGMAYVPEDRHDVGTAPDLPITDNMIATHLRPPMVHSGIISGKATTKFSGDLIKEYDIRGAAPNTEIGTLSGGNMQKVVIAREFTGGPQLLVVSQPTRGVDVGAMEFVHNTIIRQRDEGSAVLLFSADLNEVMSLSDRLLVMYRGEVIAEFAREEFDEIIVGMAMAGVIDPDEAEVETLAEHLDIADTSALNGESTPDAAVRGSDVTADVSHPQQELGDSIGDETTFRNTNPDQPVPAIIARQQQQEGLGAAEAGGPPLVVATSNRPAAKLLALAENAVQPLVAIGIALLVGAVMILLIGKNPLTAFGQLFFSPLSTPHGLAGLLSQFVPLVLLSSAVIISFRAGFFNIGGEGQLFVGAFFGAFAGFTFVDLPGPVLAVVVMAFGAVAGAIWGFIPGILYARWKTDIIVTTLMMSTIGTLFTGYLVAGPFQDPTAGLAASAKIAPQARLPMFFARFGIGMDLIIALVVVVIVGIILTRSVWGLKIRELGQLNEFATYSGVNAQSMAVQVMLVGGAIAGLAGALFVLGPNGGRFLLAFSPGYGFLGITIALLARLNPWAGILAALFYADMMAGSAGMQLYAQVPFPIVTVMQGLIVLAITATITVKSGFGKRLRGRFGRGGGSTSASRDLTSTVVRPEGSVS